MENKFNNLTEEELKEKFEELQEIKSAFKIYFEKFNNILGLSSLGNKDLVVLLLESIMQMQTISSILKERTGIDLFDIGARLDNDISIMSDVILKSLELEELDKNIIDEKFKKLEENLKDKTIKIENKDGVKELKLNELIETLKNNLKDN